MDTLTTRSGEHDEDHLPFVAVAVITTVGTFPDEDDYRRVPDTEQIKAVLEQAADKFNLTNTANWIAIVGEREINPERTFRDEKLHCIVEIEWHKREGGGGA